MGCPSMQSLGIKCKSFLSNRSKISLSQQRTSELLTYHALSPVSPLPTKDIRVINQFTELLLCFAVLSFLQQCTDLSVPGLEA